MKYLEIYDKNRNFLEKVNRKNVYLNVFWHKIVLYWLYDANGCSKLKNIYEKFKRKKLIISIFYQYNFLCEKG